MVLAYKRLAVNGCEDDADRGTDASGFSDIDRRSRHELRVFGVGLGRGAVRLLKPKGSEVAFGRYGRPGKEPIQGRPAEGGSVITKVVGAGDRRVQREFRGIVLPAQELALSVLVVEDFVGLDNP